MMLNYDLEMLKQEYRNVMEKKQKNIPADYKQIENQIIGQIKKIDYILQLNQFAANNEKI
jgi:hypothetical protein